jgi:hypothetical protein
MDTAGLPDASLQLAVDRLGKPLVGNLSRKGFAY